jgi:toxin ParE1/3/4
MKVRWTRQALGDLRHLHEYIAEENPEAAGEMIARIHEAATEHLAMHPRMGKEGRVSGTRELILAGTPYLLVYVLEGSEIQIVTILHSSRRWPD